MDDHVPAVTPSAGQPHAGVAPLLPGTAPHAVIGAVAPPTERWAYRTVVRLLGPPLVTSDLQHERLSNKLALGVLSSDCISSSAYGTEEILLVLVPLFGLAAYNILLPMTGVILLILLLVTLCYRQVVMLYTQAGGSYVVARENFGPFVAQIAAVALMLDYIVTVAVQSAAGTDAVVSAFPLLESWKLELTVGVVLILFYGNLRGLREAGRAFAVPTYFFVVSMSVVIVMGAFREFTGDLPMYDPATAPHAYPLGGGSSLLSIGAIYVLLKAFANGGSSLTGLEAISNGVSVFHRPTGLNARKTLVVMSCLLGFLVMGVSWLAHVTHAVPYTDGNPTVISQVSRAALGDSAVGHLGFLIVQLATCLILYTGANTPFNGFPFLANFVAEDGFLPRWLTKRGHRLAFSNGIMVLTFVALALLIGTGAHVDKLVAFYAIGVFTGFTLAGFGMAKHFLAGRAEKGWRIKGVLDVVVGCVAALVVVIFAVTKFTEGAWLVVVMFAVLVPTLLRLRRVYVGERRILDALPPQPTTPRSSRSTIIVLVDRVDLAVLRALSYAKTLRADRMSAVHVVLDTAQTRRLEADWAGSANADIPLELLDCPDRRIGHSVVELATRIVHDRKGAQVTVILPRRSFGLLGRILHDRTADSIASALSGVPGVVATIVPFDMRHPVGRVREAAQGGQIDQASERQVAREAVAVTAPARPAPLRDADRVGNGHRRRRGDRSLTALRSAAQPYPGATWIADVARRRRERVAGTVRSVIVLPIAGRASLLVDLADETGSIALIFYGRRQVLGIEPGARLLAHGMVGSREGGPAIANPTYTLLPR